MGQPGDDAYRQQAGSSILDAMAERAGSNATDPGSTPYDPGSLEFRILGPVEIVASGAAVALGGRKQQAVLAHLIVHRNELVPADTLVDELWGEAPPDYARNNVQTYISHLRRALGRDRIEWRPPGYLLTLDAAELDAARFEALARQARKVRAADPRAAVDALNDALALWRGQPFGGLVERGSLVAEAARLDEMHLSALEERLDALLAAGDQGRVIGEVEKLVAQHPLRERLWALLMLAYYREGRQADALAAFGRARDILAEELGVDPSPQVARLHERILRQDPTLVLRGEPLCGYRLLEKIGGGPQGELYRALQPRFEREVTVKIFSAAVSTDAEFVRYFEQRAQAVAALEHPHIVPIYDYWREPGQAYLVSRYFRGGSLRARLAGAQPVDVKQATQIVGQLASALAFAHRQGVAHGKVSSSNVLLDGDGNAYLGDFRLGIGSTAEPAADGRELARLARALLGEQMSAELHALAERAETGADMPTAEAFVLASRTPSPTPTGVVAAPGDARNPYKGLRPFTEADAGDFFGRGQLIRRLIARLREPGAGTRFLAVIGPSGSGKSSVVRAGLVPALRAGALGDPARTYVVEMNPGAHPIEELEAALLRVAVRGSNRIHDLLFAGSRGLLEAARLIAREEHAELVLVVDQFEELFTLCAEEPARREFLEALRVAAVDPDSPLRVVITLRADFLGRPLTYPRFAELLAERSEAVSPLAPDELEQAIRGPAQRVGVAPEPGLVAQMIADVAHEPGALPLLQYTLTELFEHRAQDQLTLAAYDQVGGVIGSLSARAERILESLDGEGRRAVRQVLLRLVTLGEGTGDTRRRVPRSELDAIEVDPASVDEVISVFGRHRFLTFDRDPATREPTVEIAHEALLTAWARLRDWIADAREDVRQERRLAQEAAEWQDAGSDASFLLRGAQLEQVETWAEHSDMALGHAERAYLGASTAHRDREREDDRQRRAREAQAERRARTRLRALVAVFAVTALIAGILTVIARNQSDRAARQARIASARELAAAASANVSVDPERSILLATEAVRRTRSVDGFVLPEAEDALHRAVTASQVVLTVPGVGGRLAWTGGIFVTDGRDRSGIIDVRDAATGARVHAFRAHHGDVTDVAFSADGTKLATTGDDGYLNIWDTTSWAELASFSEPRRVLQPDLTNAFAPAFSPDGSLVGAVWGDGIVQIMNLATSKAVWDQRLAGRPSNSSRNSRSNNSTCRKTSRSAQTGSGSRSPGFSPTARCSTCTPASRCSVSPAPARSRTGSTGQSPGARTAATSPQPAPTARRGSGTRAPAGCASCFPARSASRSVSRGAHTRPNRTPTTWSRAERTASRRSGVSGRTGWRQQRPSRARRQPAASAA